MSALTETHSRTHVGSTPSGKSLDPVAPDAAAPRRVLHVASDVEAAEPRDKPAARDRAPPVPQPQSRPARLPPLLDVEEEAPPRRFRNLVRGLGKVSATLAIVALAVLASLVIWDVYVTAPWTRDGRIRVQVASVAPQVSGQITNLRVRDNQFVHKGDVLYIIDKFDFRRTLETAKTQLRMKAADLQVKKVQAERRQHLSDLATTPEEQQQYVGNATQAQAAFDAAQQDVNQADVNLQRTEVQSPVNGYVTNLLMRVGDYAREGTNNISVIDADSYWIDGYFEETKMAHVCIGDRAEAQLMGYRAPIVGRVSTVTRGISVSDAAPSTQGLPNVDPIYTWVRLAQRVPVRISITQVPDGVPLVSGMTATVTVREPTPAIRDPWYVRRWRSVREAVVHLFEHPQPHARCISPVGSEAGVSDTIKGYEVPQAQNPRDINPGLAPGMAVSPRFDR